MLDLLKTWPVGAPVPILSVPQPLAAAIAWLGKDVENRAAWTHTYRGPVLIRSGTHQPTPQEIADVLTLARRDGVQEDELRQFSRMAKDMPDLAIPFGSLVAIAELYDVLPSGHTIPEGHLAENSPWGSPEAGVWLCLRRVTPVMPMSFAGGGEEFGVPFEVAASLRPLSAG